MKHELMQLPYAMDALEPYMSKETLSFHYEKHHQTYVTKLNGMIDGTAYSDKNLIDIVKTADGAIFNNAAQIYNHDFFWHSLSPNKTTPTDELKILLEHDFGSVEKFIEAFTTTAVGHFGSGWVWLVFESGKLKIVTTSNAATPITDGLVPLLALDVWEHAYYIDYRNVRPDYITGWWALVNWDFALENLKAVL